MKNVSLYSSYSLPVRVRRMKRTILHSDKPNQVDRERETIALFRFHLLPHRPAGVDVGIGSGEDGRDREIGEGCGETHEGQAEWGEGLIIVA